MSYKHCVQKATVSVKSLHNTNTSFMLYQKQIQLVLTANTTKIKMMIGSLLCPQTWCWLQSGPSINWLYILFNWGTFFYCRILKMARNYNCAQAFLCLSGSGMETTTWLLLENLHLPPHLPLCNRPQCQYLENAILYSHIGDNPYD